MWVKLYICRRSKPWPGCPVPCTEERPLDPLTLAFGRSDTGLRNLVDIRFVRGSFQFMNGQLVVPVGALSSYRIAGFAANRKNGNLSPFLQQFLHNLDSLSKMKTIS